MGFAYLPERGVVAVRGADAVPFLQGLVSNDVAGIAPGEARWAALLTPQGKWLADFFVLAAPDGLLLDCEAAQAPMLVRLLSRYRLRAKVAVEDASASFAVHAAWGEGEEAAVRAAGLPEVCHVSGVTSVLDALDEGHRAGLVGLMREWAEANRNALAEILAEVTGVDAAKGRLLVAGGHVPYDYLVLAAGATHAYFGNDHWAAHAPGLKTLDDALLLRRRLLLAPRGRAAERHGVHGGGAAGPRLGRRPAGRHRASPIRARPRGHQRAILRRALRHALHHRHLRRGPA